MEKASNVRVFMLLNAHTANLQIGSQFIPSFLTLSVSSVSSAFFSLQLLEKSLPLLKQ